MVLNLSLGVRPPTLFLSAAIRIWDTTLKGELSDHAASLRRQQATPTTWGHATRSMLVTSACVRLGEVLTHGGPVESFSRGV